MLARMLTWIFAILSRPFSATFDQASQPTTLPANNPPDSLQQLLTITIIGEPDCHRPDVTPAFHQAAAEPQRAQLPGPKIKRNQASHKGG